MRPPRERSRLALIAVVVTNAVPIVGVALWEWPLAALLFLYWFELGVSLFWAAVRALFAQRPSEHLEDHLLLGATRYKRGGLSLPRTEVTIQVSHLPVLAVVVPFLGLLWLFVGAAVMGGIDQAAGGHGLGQERTAATVGLGAIGIVVGQGLSTLSTYFLAGKYEAVNAQMALRTALWPILVVGIVLVLGGTALGAGSSGMVVIVALVGTKVLFDLAGHYRDRLRAIDEDTFVDVGWAYEPPERPAVDGTLPGPVETVRPRRRCVVTSGLVRGLRSVQPMALVVFVLVVALGLLVTGSERGASLFLAFDAVLLGGLAIAGVVDRSIRHLAMEYRVDGDVVGYDRLLGEPQWRVPEWKVDRAEPDRTPVDRLFGTETLAVDHGDRTIRLVHLPDAATVREASRGTLDSASRAVDERIAEQ